MKLEVGKVVFGSTLLDLSTSGIELVSIKYTEEGGRKRKDLLTLCVKSAVDQ